MRLRKLGCIVFLTIAMFQVSIVSSSEAKRSPLLVWNGVYRYAGDVRERDSIDIAIDKAIESLNPASKRLARVRLEEASRPYRDLRFEFLGTRFRSWMDGVGPWVSGITGELSKERSRDGHRVEVGHHVGPHRMVQVIRTRQGQRTNIFSLSNDGKRMIVDVRIDAEKLPETVRFLLTYVRTKT